MHDVFGEDEKDRRISELEKEVGGLKKKVDDHDDDFCCCCLLGVAAFLILNSNSHGATLNDYQKGPTAIVETVEHTQDNYLLRQIENYQKNISPQLKEKLGKEKLCRYTPSCSEYAKQSIEKHGSTKGTIKAINRLLRCNPFSKGGYDPVK